LFAFYHSVTRDELFFPRARAVAALQEICGRARIAVLGDRGLPPSVNLVYGLDQLPACDALQVFEVERALRAPVLAVRRLALRAERERERVGALRRRALAPFARARCARRRELLRSAGRARHEAKLEGFDL
jgi:hypothetical protein